MKEHEPMQFLFGQMVRDARGRRKMSQTELAERCGVTQPLIVKWEKADHALSEKTLQTVARGFGITVEELLLECLLARQVSK